MLVYLGREVNILVPFIEPHPPSLTVLFEAMCPPELLLCLLPTILVSLVTTFYPTLFVPVLVASDVAALGSLT